MSSNGKGLKLRSEELSALLRSGSAQMQFWMFHGRELALAHPGRDGARLRLLRREVFPGKAGWSLSVLEGNVSRETQGQP